MKFNDEQQPIPNHWRQVFREVVAALVAEDYQRNISCVEPIDVETATQIKRYVNSYGATLIYLPEDTWRSSVCINYGDYWEVLIDLWTREEGRSDMILHAKVTNTPDFSVKVHLVYVP